MGRLFRKTLDIIALYAMIDYRLPFSFIRSTSMLASLIRTQDYQRASNLGVLAILREDESDHCGWYWDRAFLQYRIEQLVGSRQWKDQKHIYWKLGRLYRRWRRFSHYVREIKPQWENVGEIHYADNSVVMKQRDASGNTREVTLVSPSGDRCF